VQHFSYQLGEGAEAGEGSTIIMSLWFPTWQWLGTLQMYHFMPGVARVITSFPLVKGWVPAGATHFWKLVPLTAKTLWTPFGYLKTAPRRWFIHHQLIYKTKMKYI
jgi:hypothetical protein